MTEDRFAKVQRLFLNALELPPDQRSPWLIEACEGDVELRSEVAALLAESGRQDDPLELGALPRPFTSHAQDSICRPSVAGYHILRRLAIGGQAVVYEAVQVSTQQQVAIKLLRAGVFSTKDEEVRFSREVSALAKIQHPHIVPIIDRGTTKFGVPYLVTQFINGWPIDKYVDQRLRDGENADPDSAKLLSLFARIAAAVQFAHKQGVVHRDLKPSNILVDENGEPRLLDFGLAKSVDTASNETTSKEITVTGGFLGSLPWASPEQANGQSSRIDHRTDVYSLGVILYQMLTGGRFPYQVVGNMRDVLDNILNAAPTPPSKAMLRSDVDPRLRQLPRTSIGGGAASIHPTLEAIVLKALAKSPDCRHQSAGELADDILSYVSGRPPAHMAEPVLTPVRRPVLSTLTGALGVLIAIAVIWYASDYLSSNRPTPNADSLDGAVVDSTDDAESELAIAADQINSHAFQSERDLSVDRTENEIFERLSVLLAAKDFRRAAGLYRDWYGLHPPYGPDEIRCTELIFDSAVAIYPGGPAEPSAAEAAELLFRAVIECNPDAITQKSEHVAGLCGNARVVLGYLLTEATSPLGSAKDLADLYEAVRFAERLEAKYTDDGTKGYVAHRGSVSFALGRHLIVAGRFDRAAHAFERALGAWRASGVSKSQLPAYYANMADLAMLLFALPDEMGSHSRASEYAREASLNQPNQGRFLVPVAADHFRHARYHQAEDTLLDAQRLEGGHYAANWLYLAMTLAKLDRPDESRSWFDKSRASVNRNPPTTPETISEQLLLREAKSVIDEDAAASAETDVDIPAEIARQFELGHYIDAANTLRRWRSNSFRQKHDAMNEECARIIDLEIKSLLNRGTPSEISNARILARALIDANCYALPETDSRLAHALVNARLFLCTNMQSTAHAERLVDLYEAADFLERAALFTSASDAKKLHAARGAACLALGTAAQTAGRFDEALNAYDQSIRHFVAGVEDPSALTDASFHAAWLELATRRKSADGHARALDRAVQAYNADERRGDFLTAVAAGHYRCDRYQQAVKTLQRAQMLENGDDERNWIFLSMALFKLGRTDEAGDWLEKSLSRLADQQSQRSELMALSQEARELISY